MNLPPHNFCFVGASVIVVTAVQVSRGLTRLGVDHFSIDHEVDQNFHPTEAEVMEGTNHIFYRKGMKTLSKTKGGWYAHGRVHCNIK